MEEGVGSFFKHGSQASPELVAMIRTGDELAALRRRVLDILQGATRGRYPDEQLATYNVGGHTAFVDAIHQVLGLTARKSIHDGMTLDAIVAAIYAAGERA